MTGSSGPTKEDKIKDALRAAPAHIAQTATVVDWDMKTVFPEGTGHILQGIGHDTTSGLPYVRPIPGAEPLLVVPIAKPGEQACGCPTGCTCGCQD